MRIGIKGSDHNGRIAQIYFDRVPGINGPMVRISTKSEMIYISEESFGQMVVALFSESNGYMPRHGREELR